MESAKKNIAIIGSGISGLGSAYLLNKHHNISIFEKNDYIGGHSRTINVKIGNDDIDVDTGFIVFNFRNYPLLTSLFEKLKVPIVKSDMSFGASVNNGWLEYSTQGLKNIFAQKANIIRPEYITMLNDILRFNRNAQRYIDCDPAITINDCLKELNMSEWFKKYYLLAMGSAIWSSSLTSMLDFPVSSFIRFFANHGLLTINDQPEWYTVKGGSKNYINLLTKKFRKKIYTNCAIKKVERLSNNVILSDDKGNVYQFDDVIFACHSDQALKLIQNPTLNEKHILSQIKYQPNRIVVHGDKSFMPKNKNAWASWVYISNSMDDKNPNISLSYWMNNLQPLATSSDIFITLNPSKEPKKELIYDEYMFEHPVFDKKAINAQSKINHIQGVDKLWFCGAYHSYGFHEDGLLSAVNMAKKMGIEPEWI